MRASTGIRLAAEPASAAAPSDAADELARRRDPGPEPGDLLSAADLAFPRADASNVPSLREIQRALRVGQPKAQQVQAHFAGRDADAV
jgi:hypothetical protein